MSTVTLISTDRILPPLRLTRRGRLVVFGLSFVVLLAALVVVFGGSSAAIEHPRSPAPTRVVLVGSGQTLWDIAAHAAADGRTGDMVARIEVLNHLDNGMLFAGQRIMVPVGG